MSKMKEFLMNVSVDMGYGGEINDEVVEAAQQRMVLLLDRDYDQIKEEEVKDDN